MSQVGQLNYSVTQIYCQFSLKMPAKSKKKTRVCSQCKRPARGHVGPYGPRCNMDKDYVQDLSSSETRKTPHSVGYAYDQFDDVSPDREPSFLREWPDPIPAGRGGSPANTENYAKKPAIPAGRGGIPAPRGQHDIIVGAFRGAPRVQSKEPELNKVNSADTIHELCNQMSSLNARLDSVAELVEKIPKRSKSKRRIHKLQKSSSSDTSSDSDSDSDSRSPPRHRSSKDRHARKGRRRSARRHSSESDVSYDRHRRRRSFTTSDSDSDTKSHKHKHKNSSRFICLANGARVETKKIKGAKKGEFVELTDFLPCITSQSHMVAEIDDQNNVIMKKSQKGKPVISDFHTWLVAFSGYMEVIVDK